MNRVPCRLTLGCFVLLSCGIIAAKTFAQPGVPGYRSLRMMEWSQPVYRPLKSIAYGNGIFVAVNHSTILTSQNGSDWTNRSSGIIRVAANINFDSETYSANGDAITFVFPKSSLESQFQDVQLAYDAPATNDTSLKSSANKASSLSYDRGAQYHPPSRPWEGIPEVPQAFNLRSVGFGGGIFVVVGDGGGILTSQNGEHWANPNSGSSNILTGVAWGVSGFVVVGDKGTILTSHDGSDWTQRNSGTDKTLFGVAYGNGTFVAVGEYNTILASSDGINWTPGDIGPEGMESIAFGNGIFMGTSIDTEFPGKMYMDNHQTMVSTDGKNWHGVKHPYPVLEGQGGAMTFDGHSGGTTSLTFGGGLFIATSVEGIYTSKDGTNWNPSSEPHGYKSCYYGAAFGNGIFAAVGNGSAIGTNHMGRTFWATTATSKAANAWELSQTPPSRLLWGSLLNDHTFGPVREGFGHFPIFLNSNDGETWTTPNKILIQGLVYGNQVVYSLGKHPTVLSSKDGITWTRLLPKSSDQPTPVTVSSNAQNTTISGNGVLIDLNGNRYKLNLIADVGQLYEIQASTNLQDWVILTTITNSGGILNFVDRDVTNYPARFYRLRLH